METPPINLNKARKARARKTAKARADANAAFHGLTKAEKAQARAERERMERSHRSGQRERPRDAEG